MPEENEDIDIDMAEEYIEEESESDVKILRQKLTRCRK